MSALEAVIAVLKPLGWPTVGRLPSNIAGVTLAVYVDRVERSTVPPMPMHCRDWTIGVLVLSPKQDPEHADLELEAAVERVLDAVDDAQPLRWTLSERVVLEEQYNAHRVSVVVTTQREP